MTFDDFKQRIGLERYAAASRVAKDRAPGLGTSLTVQDDDEDKQAFDVVDDMADMIVEATDDPVQQVEWLLFLYEDCPTYWATARLSWVVNGTKRRSPARRLFWERATAHLASSDPALADPMWYSMWVDWFEDQRTVEEAWAAILNSKSADDGTLLRRLVEDSGPVPWTLKYQLFDKVVASYPDLHDAVGEALLRAATEYFGQLDIDGAKALATRLDLSEPVRQRVDQMLQTVRLVDRNDTNSVMDAVRFERGVTGDGEQG